MSLSSAFNTILGYQNRPMSISRAGNPGVVYGIIPATSANLTSNILKGGAWIGGFRVNIVETPHIFTAQKDTYLDISSLGVITYVEVNNADPIPSLTLGNLRVAKVVTDLTSITTVTALAAPILNNNYFMSLVPIQASPSNYFRNLAGPEEVTVYGREFVLSKQNLDSVFYPVPKKGDRITDPELGLSVISEVREMFDFGGAILGYRIRCS